MPIFVKTSAFSFAVITKKYIYISLHLLDARGGVIRRIIAATIE